MTIATAKNVITKTASEIVIGDFLHFSAKSHRPETFKKVIFIDKGNGTSIRFWLGAGEFCDHVPAADVQVGQLQATCGYPQYEDIDDIVVTATNYAALRAELEANADIHCTGEIDEYWLNDLHTAYDEAVAEFDKAKTLGTGRRVEFDTPEENFVVTVDFAPAPEKIKVAKIVIEWSELGGLEGKEFDSWDAFDNAICSTHQRGENRKAGYYKTGFVITFADGAEYGGRFDIGCDAPTLRQHVQSALEYIISESEGRKFKADPHPEWVQERLEPARNFLANYDIK